MTAQPTRWIISRSADMTFVIGSAAAGYLYLILYTVFQMPASWMWWIWSIGFDGTHIFATASRTYFDREERTRNGALLFGALALCFAAGPILVLAGLKLLLAIFVGVWAYYHVIRQHWGFVMLYKVKARDLDPRDTRLDQWFLAVMTVAPPFLRFFVHHPEELGIPARFALNKLAPGFEWIVYAGVAWVAVNYAARLRETAQWNLPKLWLLAAIVPLHWLTFGFLSRQAAVPTVTIVHNLQYHAIVWFYNRNKYSGSEAAADYGRIPAAVTRSLMAYALMGIVFSVLYRVPGFHLGRISDLAFGLFCGFGFTHYYLDSRIWHVRHDPALRSRLQLA
ncbi:MAG: hypothetical protein JNL98_19580 [Bryobacterales bacterium]|nr:hypothetical protein [Bryobacterales bacterium]